MHPQINEVPSTSATLDWTPMPIRRRNELQINDLSNASVIFPRMSSANSEVECTQQSMNCQISLPLLMDIQCQLERWKHAKINKLLNTSVMSSWMSSANAEVDGIRISTNCYIHLPLLMDIKCQFKGWRYSHINELLNTSATFDGQQVPVQRLKIFRNQGSAKYICHVWWTSNANSKVEDIHISTNC
jgi:hypothetical protein